MMNLEQINERLFKLDEMYEQKFKSIDDSIATLQSQRYEIENDYLREKNALLEEKVTCLEKGLNDGFQANARSIKEDVDKKGGFKFFKKRVPLSLKEMDEAEDE